MSISRDDALKLIKKENKKVVDLETYKTETKEDVQKRFKAYYYGVEDGWDDFDDPDERDFSLNELEDIASVDMWNPYSCEDVLLTDETVLEDIMLGAPLLIDRTGEYEEDNYVKSCNMEFTINNFIRKLGQVLGLVEIGIWDEATDPPGLEKLCSYYYALLVSSGFLSTFTKEEYTQDHLLPIVKLSFANNSYEAFRSELAARLYETIGYRIGGITKDSFATLTPEEKFDITFFLEKYIDQASYFCYLNSIDR